MNLPNESPPSVDPVGYHVRLQVFEGPLDLLLHLIKENKMDIYNIQIAEITDQYLRHIEAMKELDLDIAGEFLLMAATLAHIKSKLLVPPDETQEDLEEEGIDPRAELVRRLLEYQKYKTAAEEIFSRPLLFRDVFKREKEFIPQFKTDEPAELQEISIFKLVEAMSKLLRNLELNKSHEVELEPISVSECATKIIAKIKGAKEGNVRFLDLFDGETSKRQIVATFIAVLEMLKRQVLKVVQTDAFSEIYVTGTPRLHGDWKYDGTDEYSGQQT